MISKISFVLFVVVLVLFLLPWVTVSCAGSTVAAVSITGVDMVTGKDFGGPLSGAPSSNRLDTELLVIGALAVAVTGIVASLIWKKAAALRIILGAAGMALLLALKFKLDNQVAREGQGIIRADFLVGYWVTIATFGAATAINFLKRDNST